MLGEKKASETMATERKRSKSHSMKPAKTNQRRGDSSQLTNAVYARYPPPSQTPLKFFTKLHLSSVDKLAVNRQDTIIIDHAGTEQQKPRVNM